MFREVAEDTKGSFELYDDKKKVHYTKADESELEQQKVRQKYTQEDLRNALIP